MHVKKMDAQHVPHSLIARCAKAPDTWSHVCIYVCIFASHVCIYAPLYHWLCIYVPLCHVLCIYVPLCATVPCIRCLHTSRGRNISLARWHILCIYVPLYLSAKCVTSTYTSHPMHTPRRMHPTHLRCAYTSAMCIQRDGCTTCASHVTLSLSTRCEKAMDAARRVDSKDDLYLI